MLPSFYTRSPAVHGLTTATTATVRKIPLKLILKRYLSFATLVSLFLWLFTSQIYGPPPPPRFHRPYGHPWQRPPIGPSSLWTERAEQVKDAFIYAYDGYRINASPNDELSPLKGGKVNNFNGWGVTLFDALDTMWIMDLKEYFDEAVGIIENIDFAMPVQKPFVPFFETVIRYLGGLLSAYALSGEAVLLAQADDLAKKLLPAFNTTSGFPMYAIDPNTGQTRQGWTGGTLWAEALSNQMEYKYLAHLTGNQDYFNKSQHIMNLMYEANITSPGMFPTQWDVNTGNPKNFQFSVGAFADSAHEYLLKQWLLTGQSEPKIRDLYLDAANAIIENLLYLTPNRQLLYVTDVSKSRPSHNFEHLSCFLPGLLALGVHTLDLPQRDQELHSWAAHGLAYTCWITYADQASGLGPDEMTMVHSPVIGQGRWIVEVEQWEALGRPEEIPPGLFEILPESDPAMRDYTSRRPSYLLRPEALESFYIMWKTTGDVRWRERGWSVFQSIERHAKTKFGYASLSHVDKENPPLKDEMPSYFLAETLKYLYLLFTNEDILPLDEWVLNTEAHPFPVFHWNEEEKAAYGIGR